MEKSLLSLPFFAGKSRGTCVCIQISGRRRRKTKVGVIVYRGARCDVCNSSNVHYTSCCLFLAKKTSFRILKKNTRGWKFLAPSRSLLCRSRTSFINTHNVHSLRTLFLILKLNIRITFNKFKSRALGPREN